MNDPVMHSSHSPESPGDRSTRSEGSLLTYTALAIVIALAVRFFIAAPYLVSGPSMEPTFENSDYLIVQKLSACVPFRTDDCLYLGDPQRGDVVIFKIPNDSGETLIKRVIGLPGDTLTFAGDQITVTNAENPDGFTLQEPYLDPADLGGRTDMTVTVPPGQYFVLGDNRKVSYDSRLWGDLPRANIIGRVVVRLYPLQHVGILPGQARYSS